MDALVQMAIDLYDGKITNYSKEDANEAFRKELLALCGVDGKFDYNAFRKNQWDVFAIVSKAIDIIVPKVLDGQFDPFVEVQNTAWGDQLMFDVPDTSLFKVAKTVAGTKNLRSQSIDGGSLTLATDFYGVKIREELYRFLSGKVDWTDMINRVAKSFGLKLKTDIYNTISSAYGNLGATYGVSGSFDKTKFITLASHVEAASGMKVACFGTKIGLSKVVPDASTLSDAAKQQIINTGYLGNYMNVPLIELEQVHTAGTDNFAISDADLLFLPAGEVKIVKVGFEGDAIIDEVGGTTNADLSKEYVFLKKYGIALLPATKWGMYRLS
jgi:hypothetical protein